MMDAVVASGKWGPGKVRERGKGFNFFPLRALDSLFWSRRASGARAHEPPTLWDLDTALAGDLPRPHNIPPLPPTFAPAGDVDDGRRSPGPPHEQRGHAQAAQLDAQVPHVAAVCKGDACTCSGRKVFMILIAPRAALAACALWLKPGNVVPCLLHSAVSYSNFF